MSILRREMCQHPRSHRTHRNELYQTWTKCQKWHKNGNLWTETTRSLWNKTQNPAMSTCIRSKYNTSDSLMPLFSDNHANPPDHKWHSMRKKSSAKRKFYKGHRSLSREKSVFSKKYTPWGQKLSFRLKHTRESRVGLPTPLLLCSFGSIDVEPTVEATAVFVFFKEFFLPCILQGNPWLVYRAAVTHSTIFPRDAFRHQGTH